MDQQDPSSIRSAVEKPSADYFLRATGLVHLSPPCSWGRYTSSDHDLGTLTTRCNLLNIPYPTSILMLASCILNKSWREYHGSALSSFPSS